MTKYLTGRPFTEPASNGHKTDIEYAYAVGNATAEDVARERHFLQHGEGFDFLPPTERRKLIEDVIEQG